MNKACPVVLRQTQNGTEILAFTHPLEGKQLVKGTIEPGESLQHACIRELAEESGLVATVSKTLGVWDTQHKNQIWGFCLMALNSNPPETWDFFTNDDGGQLFQFFWQSIDATPNDQWHPIFKGAINFIHRNLG